MGGEIYLLEHTPLGDCGISVPTDIGMTAEEIAREAKGDGRTPTPPVDAPSGDGSLGILEAPLSVIQHDGSQLQSVARRGDCTGESAMALAFGGKVLGDLKSPEQGGPTGHAHEQTFPGGQPPG